MSARSRPAHTGPWRRRRRHHPIFSWMLHNNCFCLNFVNNRRPICRMIMISSFFPLSPPASIPAEGRWLTEPQERFKLLRVTCASDHLPTRAQVFSTVIMAWLERCKGHGRRRHCTIMTLQKTAQLRYQHWRYGLLAVRNEGRLHLFIQRRKQQRPALLLLPSRREIIIKYWTAFQGKCTRPMRIAQGVFSLGNPAFRHHCGLFSTVTRRRRSGPDF